MKIYKSAEDYLESILIIQNEKGKVISLDIAKQFNYSKASVSRAVKNLRLDGYILVNDNGVITLTDKGKEIAEKIYDRHITLTNFFIKIGVDEKTAEDDACKIEHDISDETFAALKKVVNK